MFNQQLKKIPGDVIWFTLFSIILHQSGYLFLFFLLPMQILNSRQGTAALFKGLTALVASIFILTLIRSGAADSMEAKTVIIFSETVIPLFLAGGLLYVNIDWPGSPGNVKKILTATAGAYILSIPVLLILSSDMFMDFYRTQAAMAVEIINRVAAESRGLELAELAEILKAMGPDEILSVIIRTFLRVYMFAFFIIISLTFWLGNTGFKGGKWQSRYTLSMLHLHEYMVWPLIGSLGLVVFDYRINTGFLGYTGWNVLLIMTLLYGLRGLGIIQGAMKARSYRKGIRVMVTVTIILLLLQPGLNYIVLIGLPLIGVSEIWINYNHNQIQE